VGQALARLRSAGVSRGSKAHLPAMMDSVAVVMMVVVVVVVMKTSHSGGGGKSIG
jgi:hypothetical protein